MRTKSSTTKTRSDDRTDSAAGWIGFGLGGNLGEPRQTLARALAELERLYGALEVAPLYRTAPLSPIDQPDFLNTVALARRPRRVTPPSTRQAQDVLAELQKLERRAGRAGGPPLGPRSLDIDLLFYGDLVMESETAPRLTLPHPRLRQRRFVLAPLCDLRPDLRLPPDGERARDLLATLGDEQRIERLSEAGLGWWPSDRSRAVPRSRG